MAETLNPLFSTPLIQETSQHAEQLNAALKPLILAQMAKSNGLNISNVGGWHSETNMVLWGGEPAKALVGHILGLADKYTKDVQLGANDKARHLWNPEMWANVNKKGAANLHHCHPGAYWSAVYYVDDGYDGSDSGDLGGYLELHDPRMPMIRMSDPDLRFLDSEDEMTHSIHRIRPKDGLLVMFPSWLNHSVSTYHGDGNRISIAINLTALPAAVYGNSN